MTRLPFSLGPTLVLLVLLLVGGRPLPQTPAPPPGPRPLVQAAEGAVAAREAPRLFLLPALRPAVAASSAPTCDPDHPAVCANAITQQFGGLYQILLLIAWEVVIIVVTLFLAYNSIIGIVTLMAGQPHAVGKTLLMGVSAIVLLAVALLSPRAVGFFVQGFGGSLSVPPVPTFAPGN